MKPERIAFITEDLSFPIDEGAKKFNYFLLKYLLERGIDFKLFTGKIYDPGIDHETIPNKLFMSVRMFRSISKFKPDLIIYSPFSSGTLLSFLRLFIIKCYYPGSRTVLINLQRRHHLLITRKILRIIRPHSVVTFSETDSAYFKKMGIKTVMSGSGVDIDQFRPAGADQKLQLRKKYGFGENDKIALHVGHIRPARNIGVLKTLVNEGFTVVITGSTSTPVDKSLQDDLIKCGIKILKDFIPCIEEMYQMSDIYVFPVTNGNAAIEFPLSVLEAMSCNIPVVTTPYGSLPDHFSENAGFAFFRNGDELVEKAGKVMKNIGNNRDKVVRLFSWDSIMEKLFGNLAGI